MGKIFISTLILIGSIAFPLRSENILTLQEAVELSLQSNLAIAGAQEHTKEVRGIINEAKSRAYPRLDFIGSFTRYRDPGILNSSTFSNFTDAGFTLDSPAEKRYNAGIYLTQNLFTWGRIPSAIKAAKLYYKQSEMDLKTTKLDTAFAVAREYYLIEYIKNELLVLEKAKETYNENLRVNNNKIEAGDATKLDLLKAQVALANIEPQLIEKKNSLEQAKSRINILLNRAISTSFTTVSISPVIVPAQTIQSADIARFAKSNRPEMASLESEKNAIAKTLLVYKSNMRPSLSLDGNWGQSVADHNNFGNNDFNSWSLSLNLKIPVFNGFETKSQLAQMRAKEKQLEAGLEELSKQIEYEVRENCDNLLKSIDQINAATKGLEYAEEALRIVGERYSLGLSSTLELLDSEREQRQAKLNLATAEYGYNLAYAGLKRALGLLPTDNIKEFENEQN